MFDLFSWSHIVILLAVALVVVGPKDLPRMMHMAGKWAGKARAMANEFRRSFDEMARQAELDELRKEIEDLKNNNPITEMANSVSEMGAVMSAPAAAVEGAGQTPPQTTPAVEGAIEPRSGEFAVTDKPAPASSSEPAAP
jgi:sec-independent protein translocase protein TatB